MVQLTGRANPRRMRNINNIEPAPPYLYRYGGAGSCHSVHSTRAPVTPCSATRSRPVCPILSPPAIDIGHRYQNRQNGLNGRSRYATISLLWKSGSVKLAHGFAFTPAATPRMKPVSNFSSVVTERPSAVVLSVTRSGSLPDAFNTASTAASFPLG